MRIGIDARELTGKPTGVGRYLAGLLREWTAVAARHAHEFVLYAHRPNATSWPRADWRHLPGGGGTLWEQFTLARALDRDGIDVLFSPAYSTPLVTRVPRVVALHDISFTAHPEWYTWREGLRRRLLARGAARAARTVVTISAFSRSELMQRLGVAAGRIAVIPPGIDPPVVSDGDAAPQTAAGVAPALMPILYVGSIFNRRHIPALIDAFTRVAAIHADVSLHLVGDNRSHPHQDLERIIAASPASARIVWHRYVSDEQLQTLYRQARAFVFLSEYEGLGLTPLEALAAGIPSLLLDTPVARESCGAAAAYVAAGDGPGTADALERLLYDEALRRALLTAAPAALARYDWRAAARDTLAVLEAAR